MAKDEDSSNKAADHQGDETQAEKEEETRHEWVLIYDTQWWERERMRERERETRFAWNKTKDYIATTRTQAKKIPQATEYPNQSTQRINLHYRYNTTARSERKKIERKKRGRKERQSVGWIMMIFYVPNPKPDWTQQYHAT